MKLGLKQRRQRKQLSLPPNLIKPLATSFFLTLVMFLFSFIYLSKAQPELPIFYTLDSTRGPLMKKWWLLLLPVIALGFNFINFSLVLKLKSQLENLLLRLFVMASLFINVIMLIALLRIIYITW